MLIMYIYMNGEQEEAVVEEAEKEGEEKEE